MKPFARTSPHALAVAIATALIPVAAAAQTSTPLQMPSMHVVGSDDDAISRQTGAVVIVTKEEIERAQPSSTQDVLRRVPGINAIAEEETGVVSNIGIRGLSASESKSLILEDGVPVAPGLFIGNDRYFNWQRPLLQPTHSADAGRRGPERVLFPALWPVHYRRRHQLHHQDT